MSVYLGTFLIAFTPLALEVTLTRLMSVTTWYHLAFFAISTAMLGMTAGATTVYLKPERYVPGRLDAEVARNSLYTAISIPVILLMLCLVPLAMYRNVMLVFSLLITACACSLPFYFGGITVSALLTKHTRPIGLLY